MAENQAGPGEDMVQLDIECKCLEGVGVGWGAKGVGRVENTHTQTHLKAHELYTKSSGLMEVRLRAHWGHFSSPGRVDSGSKEKWAVLISSKCLPSTKRSVCRHAFNGALCHTCHSLIPLVRSRYGLSFHLWIWREDKKEPCSQKTPTLHTQLQQKKNNSYSLIPELRQPFFFPRCISASRKFQSGRERRRHAAVPHSAESDALVIHY